MGVLYSRVHLIFTLEESMYTVQYWKKKYTLSFVIGPSFPSVGNGGGMPFLISAKTENFVNSTK